MIQNGRPIYSGILHRSQYNTNSSMPQEKQNEWEKQWRLLEDNEQLLFEDWIYPNNYETFRGKTVLEWRGWLPEDAFSDIHVSAYKGVSWRISGTRK